MPEFFFKRLDAASPPRYHVSVTDTEGQTYHFYMEQSDEKWQITGALKVPEWILHVEAVLGSTILENTLS